VPPTDWTANSVYHLATYQNGRAFGAGETQGTSGLPIVKIAELNRGISEATGLFDGELGARHRVTENDIVFSWSGTIVVKRWHGADAALNQHLFKVSVKPEFDEDFVLGVLQSLVPRFNEIVEDQRTTMGHVKVSDLRAMQVLVPPKPQQVAIGRALRALEDLSFLNQRIVATADRLILVRLRELALQAEGTGDVVPLTDIARFVNGGAFTRGASGKGRMVIRIRELNTGPSDTTVYSDEAVRADKEANPGDILFAWSGSLGLYRWSGPVSIINQHIFKVVPVQPAWFVYAAISRHLSEFQAIARDKATTMGHIQRHHLEEAMVRVPPPELMEAWDAELSVLWDLILAREKANGALASLRAAVVPALVTGRMALNFDARRDAA